VAADRPLLPDEKIVALGEALQAAGVPYAFGGAIALLYWSEPRGTVDIDINIFLPASDPDEAFDVVAKLGIGLNRDTARREILLQDQVPAELPWPRNCIHCFLPLTGRRELRRFAMPGPIPNQVSSEAWIG
jgi:hypothetical protein